MQEQLSVDKFELNTFQQLCVNRKKENFEDLKKWDQGRAQKLIVHRRVCDEIVESLQNKSNESTAYLNVVIQFFCDLSEQKKKYEAQNVTDPSPKLAQNLVGKTVHMTTSRALNKLYAHSQNRQHLKIIREIIDNAVNLLRQVVEKGQKDIMELRTKIELRVVQVQNHNINADSQCEKLMSTYNKERNSKTFRNQNDFFMAQQQFIKSALQQTQAEKLYGVQVANYMDYMQKYQKSKVELLKNILNDYIKCSLQNDQEKYESLKIILNKTNEDQYINIFYAIEDILSKDLMNDICKVQGRSQKQKVEIKLVQCFLRKLQIPPFQTRNLILKSYKVFIKQEEQLYQATILITVDAFMNISSGHQTHTLPRQFDYSFRLDSSILLNEQGDISLTISSQKRQLSNFLSKTTQKQLQMVFATTDLRDEFIDFINKIIK